MKAHYWHQAINAIANHTYNKETFQIVVSAIHQRYLPAMERLYLQLRSLACPTDSNNSP